MASRNLITNFSKENDTFVFFELEAKNFCKMVEII